MDRILLGYQQAFLYSYEDLEQTIWYILMVGLQEFDGRGDEEQFLNWYIRNKVVSIMMYGKKPPKCTHLPFTLIRFDYVSPDEMAEVNELFYSDGEDDWGIERLKKPGGRLASIVGLSIALFILTYTLV